MDDHNGPQLSILPAEAVRDRRITPAQFRTLAALGIFSDKEGCCFPSLSKLAEILGVSPSTVHGHLKGLESVGRIEISRRRRRNGTYSSCSYRIIPTSAEPNWTTSA